MSLDSATSAKATMAGLPARAKKVLDEYRTARARVAGDWMIPRSQKRAMAEKLRASTQAELARLDGEHREAAEQFTAAIRRTRRAPGTMTTDSQMAWDRLKSYLDAHRREGHSMTLIARRRLEDAVGDGDAAMLRAANAMLGDYLAGHGETWPEELRDWAHAQLGDHDTAEALALAKEGQHGVGWVKTALNFARSEVEGDWQPGAGLAPTWEKGTTIDFGQPPDYAAAERAGDVNAAAALNHVGRARGLRLQD